MLWQDELEPRLVQDLERSLDAFNEDFRAKLADLQGETTRLLAKLDPSIEVTLLPPAGGVRYDAEVRTFEGVEVAAAVKLFGKPVVEHHRVLNEARLSAIALAIYLASVLRTPKPELEVLVLDDVLIGLDMSHRIPVIELLNEEFADHQLFVLTYDPTWYEIVKIRTENQGWVHYKLYSPRTADVGLTIISDKGLLERAGAHHESNDFKAAAVYIRSAFEIAIENFCEKKGVPVKFHRLKKKLTSNDFWTAVLAWQKKTKNPSLIDEELQRKIELHRWLTMNRIVHESDAEEFDAEVKEAADLVRRLEQALKSA